MDPQISNSLQGARILKSIKINHDTCEKYHMKILKEE
jgi:hypothetical protein